MKKTLFELSHGITVFVSYMVGLYFNHPNKFAIAAIFFFIGREIAQAEYRWIERYGKGLRESMPWYGSIDPRVWDVHSFWWNLTFPIGVYAALEGLR
jgi:hypothetical protein